MPTSARSVATSIPMDWGQFAAPFGVFVVMVGVGLSAMVWLRERLIAHLGTRVRRFAVEGIGLLVAQALVGLSAGSITLSPQSAEPAPSWAIWLFVGALGSAVLLQLFTIIHADHAEVRREYESEQLANTAKERNFFYVVNEAFKRVVSHKREALKTAAPSDVFDAVPAMQKTRMIVASWELLNGMINADPPTAQGQVAYRVRVALFLATELGLEPDCSWNGSNYSCVSIDDNTKNEALKWSGTKGCIARTAALNGSMVLVGDTEAADRDPSHAFWFFPYRDRSSLKSIAALPLALEGDAGPHDVLVVDTDRPDFFDDSNGRQEIQLRHISENLAYRLRLEFSVASLVKVEKNV